MEQFEIRILAPFGGIALTSGEYHLSAEFAVRAARRLAGVRPFEVWRRNALIFTSAEYTQQRSRPFWRWRNPVPRQDS